MEMPRWHNHRPEGDHTYYTQVGYIYIHGYDPGDTNGGFPKSRDCETIPT